MKGPFRRVHEARRVIISFGLAHSPVDITLRVNKTEIYRLMRDEGLVLDDPYVCTTQINKDGTMYLFFAT